MKSALMEPKAIFFDLDDTILDSHGAALLAWEAVHAGFPAQLRGVDQTAFTAAVYQAGLWYWGDSQRQLYGRLNQADARRHIMVHAAGELGLADDSFAQEAGQLFVAHRQLMVAPFPGAIETLAEFRRRGMPLALITNGGAAEQREKIEKYDLTRWFDCVLVEGELGYGKPDPRVFRRALKELQVGAANTWMVGDNLCWEVAGAQALGLTAIWVDHLGTGLPADAPAVPDRTVRLISELLEVAA